MNDRQEIFLSHSGLDRELANSLARRIEQELNVRVFNTSTAEDRFEELTDILQPGELWEPRAAQYDADLTDYVKRNLLYSQVYLLLVTAQSLRTNSSWIKFEMELASKETRKRGLVFIPCVADASLYSRLPKIALIFQGVDIGTESGFKELLESINRILNKPEH